MGTLILNLQNVIWRAGELTLNCVVISDTLLEAGDTEDELREQFDPLPIPHKKFLIADAPIKCISGTG